MMFCTKNMKRKFKQWCQQYNKYQQNNYTPHLKSLNAKKIMTYADSSPGLCFGHAQKWHFQS
jgi:hypothetical protein